MKNKLFNTKSVSLLLIIASIGAVSCKSKDSADEQIEENKRSNIIELSDAVSNQQPIKLSDIADFITYVPLSDETLLRNNTKLITCDKYLFSMESVFDWSGKYLFEIGNRGDGPGEEKHLSHIINIDSSFYSLSDKLIVYDKDGKYAGKELNTIDFFFKDLGRADKNIVTCTLDTLYFFSPDLKLLKTKRVVPDWPEKSTMMSSNDNLRFFTQNEDSVLFYNYINDTIYRVLENDIEPRWVINLGEDKIPLKYLLGNELNRLEAGAKYYTNNALSKWEYLVDTDNKVRVSSVFESQKYVFIYWFRLFDFWQLRHLPPTQFQIAYFDKQKKGITAVEGDGFIDDMSSLGTFYPLKGIHGDYMLTSYWPFELKEKVEALKKKGKPVDEKLLKVLDNTSDESNPILVMVHLK